MLLSGKEIRRRLFDRSGPHHDWLVITPILDLDSQLKLSTAAIDLRLASVFVVPNRAQLSSLDPRHKHYERRTRQYMDTLFVDIGDDFVLHPRQFALGQTIEWLHLPRALAGSVVGRSRWGREGLIIATATGVHPTYAGTLTLELTNLGEVPIHLYPGLSYVQLFLHLVDSPHERIVEPATFTGTTRPVNVKAPAELDIIRRWKDETIG